MIKIIKYSSKHKIIWDEFVENSRNGTFLSKRDFMDYHSDRFVDYSLMFYYNDKLIALLPANIKDNNFYSHQGLTYGGIIVDNKAKATLVIEIFSELKIFLKNLRIKKLIYKAIPHIYHIYPTEEDLYALFRNDAVLIRRDISTTIDLEKPIKFSSLRKRFIKKAKQNNLTIKENEDISEFHNILSKNLRNKYGAHPVHTLNELRILINKFPENIKLYSSFREDKMMAGVLIFINKHLIHAQYISSSEEGREIGALDLIFDYLITEEYKEKKYFDFGISTEQQGKLLNDNLIQQKEMFGGRAICYDHYEVNI